MKCENNFISFKKCLAILVLLAVILMPTVIPMLLWLDVVTDVAHTVLTCPTVPMEFLPLPTEVPMDAVPVVLIKTIIL
jgi:hypothetical protein